MSNYNNIFTSTALNKMKAVGLSESLVLDAYNTGASEKTNRGGTQMIKKYPGYELGVIYARDNRGTYKIISVWKRDRR